MTEEELKMLAMDAVKTFYEKSNNTSASSLPNFVREYVSRYLEAKEMADIVVQDYVRDLGTIEKPKE